MKTFTKLLLAVGVIALVLYAIPLESFTSDSTTSNMNLQAIIDHWKLLSPEEKDKLRSEVRSLRGQLGLADPGVFANGRIQEPPPSAPATDSSASGSASSSAPASAPVPASASAPVSASTPASAPASASARAPAPASGSASNLAYMNAFGFDSSPTTGYPAVTRSDVQGLINDSIKQQLQSQSVANLESARNLDNRRDDPQVTQDRKHHMHLRQDKRRKQQKQIGEKQIAYEQAYPQACPSTTPDPNIWIKRDEIPCWACKP